MEILDNVLSNVERDLANEFVSLLPSKILNLIRDNDSDKIRISNSNLIRDNDSDCESD